jgi:integrase
MRAEQAYSDWMRRFGLFHNKRHAREMGVREVAAFLTHLAVTARVAAPTQNQSKSVLSLSKRVLASELGPNDVESAPCRSPGHSARDAASTASGGNQQAGHTHSLRHYAEFRLCRTRHRRNFFATDLLENGYGIRTVHESLGHVGTTMIYAGVLKRGERGVRSRLDALR